MFERNSDASSSSTGPPRVPTDLEQIRLVADHLPQLVWSCLPDGHCDYLSRGWVEYTGVPEAEHHGQGWLSAVHPEDRQRTREIWNAFVQGDADYDVDYRLGRYDGVYCWFKTRGVLVRDAEGVPVRVLGTTTDIDDQKNVEVKYRQSRERLEAALAASGAGTFHWNLGTNQFDCDEQLDRLMGLAPARTARTLQSFLEGIHPDDRPLVRRRLERCQADGHLLAMEFRVVWPDGSIHWLADRGKTIAEPSRALKYVTGACIDVTERKAAEARIREMDERAAFVRKASGVGFWYCDLPFDVLEWDHTVKEHFHLAPDAHVTIQSFYDCIHPEDRAATRAAIDASIVQRRGYDVHYRTVHPSTGAEKWIRAIGRTFYAADGTPSRFDGVTLDVTQQRRSEKRQEFLAKLASDAQPLFDPGEISAMTARRLADYLGADRCAYAEVEDESTYVITGDYAREVPSIVGRWPISAFGVKHLQMMQAGEPYVVHDAKTDSRIAQEDLVAYQATTIESVICVPLLKEGRLTAAMAVHQSVPRRWSAEEVELVRVVVGQCWETLERARAHRLLRASEERFRAFMDNSPAAAWITDAQGQVHYVSAAYARLFDTQGRDIVGATPADLYPEEFALEYVRNTQMVAQSGKALETVERAPRPDGSVGDFLVYKFPLPGARLVGGVAIDITERLRAESQLLDADRRKDEFLATLAHELRNPLAPIRNGLSVLRLVPPRSDEFNIAHSMMDRQIGHMVRLVDDLLDVSRITRNKLELRKQRVALSKIVQSAVETCRPLIEQFQHELLVAMPSAPVILNADLTRLAQVFSNLLNNSAKYTASGGCIFLTAEVADDQVVVRVRDNGMGIPATAIPNLFQMFSQVDTNMERAQGGLGIGLTLVRRLVEMHGGTVDVYSAGPGMGSEFCVRLPVLEEHHSDATRSDEDRIPRPQAKCRILIVDDNQDAARSLEIMLRAMGNETCTAYDGLAAVEMAEAYRPELIILDIGLPKINGYDACRRIREQSWSSGMTIVALSGWGQEEDRRKSKEAGFDRHLVKPLELAALEDLLARPTLDI